MAPRESDPPAEPGPRDGAKSDGSRDAPVKPPVRVEPPPAAEEEMGGEQPCQLHQWWNVDE